MIPCQKALSERSDIVKALVAAKAPLHIVAVLESLQFGTPSTQRLGRMTANEWQQLLWWCDNRQLTLLLPATCGPSLPPHVKINILKKTARYSIRFERLKRSLFEIADAFDSVNLDFVLLKGLSHAPAMTPDAVLRAQGDIDLWLPGESIFKAREILKALGYTSVAGSNSRHLGPMARPSSWQWRGDLFDPDMPISIELHYELWSERAEFVKVPQIEEFWARRTARDFDGHKIHVLCDEDMLGFAALHLLLHLLHGDLPLQRAWEIARFLDTHAENDPFWERWRTIHDLELRQLEIPMYYLVSRWFGCRWPLRLRFDVFDLPEKLRFWLGAFSLSPLIREWRPNKREVWLHLALIRHRKDQAKVLLRRLFPLSLPPTGDRVSGRKSFTFVVRRLRFVGSRFIRHLFTLMPTICDGLRLAMSRRL